MGIFPSLFCWCATSVFGYSLGNFFAPISFNCKNCHDFEFVDYFSAWNFSVVNRIVSGARYGLRDWLMQRIAAVILLMYSLFVLGFVILNMPMSFALWHTLFTHDWMRFFTLLSFMALYLHAWVGIRNVLMDYVHSTGIRLTLHGCVIVALVIYFIWTVQILWGK